MAGIYDNYMIKNLTCPVCKNLFISPVIASCCSNTFCITCVGNSGTCPICKRVSGFSPNRIVNDLVDTLPYKCVCGQTLVRKDRKDHDEVCEAIMKPCKKCNFSGNLSDRIVHLLNSHPDAVISYYSEIV